MYIVCISYVYLKLSKTGKCIKLSIFVLKCQVSKTQLNSPGFNSALSVVQDNGDFFVFLDDFFGFLGDIFWISWWTLLDFSRWAPHLLPRSRSQFCCCCSLVQDNQLLQNLNTLQSLVKILSYWIVKNLNTFHIRCGFHLAPPTRFLDGFHLDFQPRFPTHIRM